jgi:hypothetical protein
LAFDKQARAQGTTFAKMFQRQDETGLALRKAVEVAKQAQWVSRTSTLGKAMVPADLRPRVSVEPNINNPKTALAQLKELADEQRRRNPTLSEAGAFARAYAENPALAAKERSENRPRAAC